MNKLKFTIHLIAALALVAFSVSLAQAQSAHTWVSGVGDDANPCSRTAPCKSFAGAISKTAKVGGEINAIDPGGYGRLVIFNAPNSGKRVTTVDGQGTLASVQALGGISGITVNTQPGDIVVLRNLLIRGVTTGSNGIEFLGGGRLVIENCVINGFTVNGIDFEPNAAGSELHVKDTTIINCANGIFMKSTPGISTVTAKNVYVAECATNGFDARDNIRATVTDSTASGNAGAGFAVSTASASVEMNVTRCVTANNVTGMQATTASALIRVMNSSILDNGTGISISGGAIGSSGDNIVAGNGATANFSGTIPKT